MGAIESVAAADGDDRLNYRILRAVAEREGTNPTELEPPLYEVVDPDALESLHRFDGVTTEFRYHGYLVTVSDGGKVDVTEPSV